MVVPVVAVRPVGTLGATPSAVVTWTGAVVATAGGARIISNDNSCVTPSDLFAETRTDGLGLAMNAFKNYAYTGAAADNPALSSMDRTREGFFEVIEMGVIDDDLISRAGPRLVDALEEIAAVLYPDRFAE